MYNCQVYIIALFVWSRNVCNIVHYFTPQNLSHHTVLPTQSHKKQQAVSIFVEPEDWFKPVGKTVAHSAYVKSSFQGVIQGFTEGDLRYCMESGAILGNWKCFKLRSSEMGFWHSEGKSACYSLSFIGLFPNAQVLPGHLCPGLNASIV